MIENLLPSHVAGELDVLDAFDVNLHLEQCEGCRAVRDRLSREGGHGGAARYGVGHRPADLTAIRSRMAVRERKVAEPSLVKRLRTGWRNLGRPWKAALAGAAAAAALAVPIAKLPGLGAEPVLTATREMVGTPDAPLLAPLPAAPVLWEIPLVAKKVARRIPTAARPTQIVRTVASRPARRNLSVAPTIPQPEPEPAPAPEPVAVARIHGLGAEPVLVPVARPTTAPPVSEGGVAYAVISNAGPEVLLVRVRVAAPEVRAQVAF